MKRLGIIFVLLLALEFSTAYGGGFLLVDEKGPYRWNPSQPIKYKVDRGGLNALFDEERAADLVRSVFQQWQDIPTVSIPFQFDGLLDVDVTAQNALQYLRRRDGAPIPIVFDRDGSITRLLLGEANSRIVLGFTRPTDFDTETHTILKGETVINGSVRVSERVLNVTMLHEFGHLLGLDHTQAGLEFRNRFDHSFVPVMFPIVFSDSPRDLQDDDLLWITNLYPTAAAFQGTGTISGFVDRAWGDPFQGANVILRNTDYDPSRGQVRIYSVVSDYLLRNSGEFRFHGVKPGDYELFIEPLDLSFVSGSSVGPFESRFTNFSRDFYNGDRESGNPDTDDPNEKVVLSVPPDTRIENIVMVSNELANNLTALADDDTVVFDFPNGFKFPFYGKTYGRVFVNSDGNLTFGRPEYSSTERDLQRFVSGPPRVGAMFSDLNPEAMGEVLFTQRDHSVTFTWMNVPEFSENQGEFGTGALKADDGNQFSVTLFTNGDVEFRYGHLKVTRGEDEELAAVVGVTPGGGAVTQQLDLSQNDSYRYGDTPGMVEVFSDSLDLAGRKILFRSGSAAAVFLRRTLVVPFLQGNGALFTALAVTNRGNSAAKLSFTAYGADGSQLYAAEQAIGPTAQLAKLANELFGIAGSESPSGWIQLQADTDSISSFFQVGSFDGRWLDGGTVFTEISTHLYLTRVFEGNKTLQGKDAQTWISIVNPNDVTVRVLLSLYSASGGLRSRQQIQLSPHGLAFDRLNNLFKDATFPQESGYISIQGIGGGLAAFELVYAGDTAVGLSAVAPGFAAKFYSAQLAHGNLGTGSISTSLNIVNTNRVAVTVNARAFDEKHQPLGSPFSRELQGLEAAQLTAKDLFNLGDPLVVPVSVGSIELSSDSAGVVADVLFGDASPAARFVADLPLQSDLVTEAYFSYVANGRLRANDPASGYFTGIALYNPNSIPASVTLEVFTPEGEVKRSGPIVLQPGERTSRLISEFVPAVGIQVGGYIVLKSDAGVIVQELFANEPLDFLSAVPPDIVKKAKLR
ncbi:MAG: matrixin family metalloprotease [Acidobacteria bacterium]|nr:matrixin family metalloprotease [Acidobacteriota bacterium]